MGFNVLGGVRDSYRPPPKRTKKTDKKLVKIVRSTGNRTVAPAARSVKRETPKVVAREVARQPRAKRATKVDPAYARALAEVERYEKSKAKQPKRPQVQTGGVAGLSPLLQAGNLGGDGRSIGGFLTNLGAGAVRVITDAPAAAQLGAEAALYPFVKATNLAQGRGARGPRPGIGSAVERQLEGDLKAAGAGVKADYAYRYGPLLRGDVGTFGARFYDDPTPTLLDAGGAYSLAGRAPAAAARAGAAVTTGRVSDRLARAGSRSRVAPGEIDVVTGQVSASGGKLYRAPKRRVGTATGETPRGNLNTGSRVIETPRRPYSPNVITRAGQRGADRVKARVTPKIERYAEARQPLPGQQGSTKAAALRPLTAQGKFDRAQARATRDLIFNREQRAAGVAGRDAAPFVSAVRKLKPDKNPAGVRQKGIGTEAIATSLHLDDVLSARAGLTPSQLRDLAVERMERGIAKAEARGDRTTLTRRQVEQIKAIPAELLDLKDMDNPAVVRVATAVQEGRNLDKISQGRAVRGGVIDEKTATAIRSRASSLLLGGSEWSPALLKEMKKAGASKAERAAVRADAIDETPRVLGARARLGELDAKVTEARLSGKMETAAKREAKRDAYLKTVRREEDRALGFTSPTRPELVGSKGVYRARTAVDKTGDGGAFPRRKGFSGQANKAKRDKGYLTQKGGFDMNPELLAHQAKRAADAEVGPMSNAALNELIGIAAYLDDAGKMVSGKRAVQMARTDPDRVVLVSRVNLRKALKQLDELEDGKTLDPGDVKMFYGEGKEPWLQAIPDGPDVGQYVAISKAAADVWREAPTTVPVLKAADRVLDYWKGGILALSPRWYANSAIGVGTQYGLLAGGDVRSLVQAVRKGPIKDAVPDEVVLNNLANDVGFKGSFDANRLERTFAAGFRVNNRMESAWRRAAYINRGKKALRDEGKRFRGLSDEEIARAIDSMPPSIARNVIRDVDLFMGEFRKFNSFERNVVRRVVPFYSWLRVISRLTLTLPFRSPVRAAALNTLGRAGELGINPDDYARPVYDRGALKLGKYRIPTSGFSNPATLTGFVQAATKIADDPSSALGQIGEEAVGWARPEIQTALAATYGTTPFGNSTIAPTGYGGTVSGFGGREAIDPSTGLVGTSRVRVPIDEALLQTFGGAPAQALRKLLSDGERPFDTTRTLSLLNARLTGGSTKGMFLDPSGRPVKKYVGKGLGSIAGVNPSVEDRAELLRRYKEAQRDFKRKKRRQDRKK